MDLSPITKSYRQLGRVLSKNSPTILTALGVAGLLSTVILAIKATPDAMEIIEYEKEFRDAQYKSSPDQLSPFEITTIDVIELTWKCYIPTIIMGLTTTTCIIGANHINLRRNAALVSLFSLTETALKEYQAKVVETIGKAKEEKIQEEIIQDKLDNNPVKDGAVILTGKGDYLCYDSFSSRYFRSNVDSIQRSENMFNQKLLREGWMDINQFYDELGLDPIELGNNYGWVGQYNLLQLRFTVKLAKNDEPCLVLEYRVQPSMV